jgi:hypothetical protein
VFSRGAVIGILGKLIGLGWATAYSRYRWDFVIFKLRNSECKAMNARADGAESLADVLSMNRQ